MAVKSDRYKAGDTKVYGSEAEWRSSARKKGNRTTKPSKSKGKRKK